MDKLNHFHYSSPVGELTLVFDHSGRLLSCREGKAVVPLSEEHPDIAQLLDDYFGGVKTDFSSVELRFSGTSFSIQILQALRVIPYGTTVSYANLARLAGKPKAVRAAAHAVAENDHLLFIPCHRVIRSNGEIGKFRLGSELKRYLLELEKAL